MKFSRNAFYILYLVIAITIILTMALSFIPPPS